MDPGEIPANDRERLRPLLEAWITNDAAIAARAFETLTATADDRLLAAATELSAVVRLATESVEAAIELNELRAETTPLPERLRGALEDVIEENPEMTPPGIARTWLAELERRVRDEGPH